MPTIRPRDLPDYVSRAGDPCFPPPYKIDEAGMDIFICEGDENALRTMIDRALNGPTTLQFRDRHKLNFELADPRVGFACIDVWKMQSMPVARNQVDSLDGLTGIEGIYAHQTEVAVMVQVRDQTGMPYWYLPYVLNNLPTAVTTGREIYGYPKQHAVFTADDRPPTAGDGSLFGPDRRWQRVAVHAFDIHLPSQGNQAEFALKKVLEFRRCAPESGSNPSAREQVTPRSHPSDFEFYPGRFEEEEGDRRLVADTGPDAPSEDDRSENGANDGPADAFLRRIRSDVPYVFLRQFRDPELESSASLQSLVIGRLVPDSEDDLTPQRPEFKLVMPWAYNLALAKELFGRTQKVITRNVEPPALEYPVIGLLSGSKATFNVLRAAVLWQFGPGAHADTRAADQFMQWRDEHPGRQK